MKIEITNPSLFRVCQTAQGKNDIRCYLNGVYLADEYAVGTDGHRLVKAKCLEKVKKPVIIRAKILPANTVSATIDTTCKMITCLNSKGYITLLPLEIIDGRYPDFKKIINSGKPEKTDTISFNSLLISDIQKAGNFAGFKFTLNGKDKAMHLSVGSTQDIDIYLMPMRL